MRTARFRSLNYVLAGCLLLAGGCAAGQPEAATTPTADASLPPAASPSATQGPQVPPYQDGNARTGPAEPIIGTAYPFDLYVHCEGVYARFGNRFWRTEKPPGNLSPLPRPDGSRKITGFVAGTMELIDADSARFTIDTSYVTTAEPIVEYEMITQTPPGCM